MIVNQEEAATRGCPLRVVRRTMTMGENEAIARGPQWTDESVARLRQRLLEDALRRLSRRRTTSENRRALMAWVLSDAIHPFSFRVCAAASGYDADALRDGFLRVIAPDIDRGIRGTARRTA